MLSAKRKRHRNGISALKPVKLKFQSRRKLKAWFVDLVIESGQKYLTIKWSANEIPSKSKSLNGNGAGIGNWQSHSCAFKLNHQNTIFCLVPIFQTGFIVDFPLNRWIFYNQPILSNYFRFSKIKSFFRIDIIWRERYLPFCFIESLSIPSVLKPWDVYKPIALILSA